MRKEAAVAMVLGCLGWFAPSALAASDVLARWSFDEGSGQTVGDSSAHGHAGQLGADGGADPADPTWIAGRDGGGALAFSGAQYVAVPDSDALEPGHVGVEAWVRRAGSPGRWRYVLSKGSVGCDRSAYGLYSGWSGGMAFYVSNTTHYTISPEVSAGRVWDGAWHHVVGSYDGERVRLWLDGAQVGSGTPASAPIAYGVGSKGVYIGMYRGSCELGFSGSLDDVAVWTGTPSGPLGALPAVPSVPGAPTEVAVGDNGRGATASMRASGGVNACLRVSLNRRTVPVARFARLVATVRRGTKRVSGARVVVSGAGVRAGARTNRLGLARVRVQARKRGQLSVKVRGQRAGCSATRTVRAR